MKLSGKKLFIIGAVAILLAGVPITVYFLQQQTNTNSHAEASTTLSFTPPSSSSSPIQSTVGASIPLNILVNPGNNAVDTVTLTINYDPSILATASANALTVNASAFS